MFTLENIFDTKDNFIVYLWKYLQFCSVLKCSNTFAVALPFWGDIFAIVEHIDPSYSQLTTGICVVMLQKDKKGRSQSKKKKRKCVIV